MDTLLTYYLVYLLRNLNQGMNLLLPAQQEDQIFLDKSLNSLSRVHMVNFSINEHFRTRGG